MPHLSPTATITKYRVELAAFIILLLSVASWAVISINFGSPWIKATIVHSTNSLLGFSETSGVFPYDMIIHKENRSFIQQISMFSGATTEVVDKPFMVRPFYAFFSGTFAPLVGIQGAALLCNALLWALAAWCSWILAMQWFADRRVAMMATLLVATGMGFTVHVIDYSAHLASFTTYYLGVLALYVSKLWSSPAKSFREHLTLGLFLALCCLTYNSGVPLVVAYIILAARTNRPHHVAITALVALSAPYCWVAALNLGYALVSGQWVWYDLYNSEQGYLKRSLAVWLSAWSNPLGGFKESLRIFLQFLTFECPLTVGMGFIAIALMLIRRRPFAWFGLLVFLLPFAGPMVFAQSAAARGYLVFGCSIIVYVAIAGELGNWLNASHPGWRRAGYAVITTLVLAQIVWSGAHATGHFGPLRAYYLGLESALPAFSHPPSMVVSLTGHEPTPSWFGGSASFAQAGLYDGGGMEPTKFGLFKQIALSLAARGILALYVILFVISWFWARERLTLNRALLATIFILGVPSLIMAATIHKTYRFVPIDQAGLDKKCTALSYTVGLSDTFRSHVTAIHDRTGMLELFFKPFPSSSTLPRVRIDGRELPLTAGSGEGTWQTDFAAWFEPLGTARHIEIILPLSGTPVRYLGWQRAGLPDRALALEGCPDAVSPEVLPALEIRVRSGDGEARLIGF